MNANTYTWRAIFAATCPEQEVERRMPDTVGEMLDELKRRKMITGDATRYTNKERQRLRCIVRFEYADDMLSIAGHSNDS